MLVDRATSRIAYVVSTEGGMDIEKVAHDTPEKIMTFSVDPATGFMPLHGRMIAKALKLSGDLAKKPSRLRASSTRPSSRRTCRCWKSIRSRHEGRAI